MDAGGRDAVAQAGLARELVREAAATRHLRRVLARRLRQPLVPLQLRQAGFGAVAVGHAEQLLLRRRRLGTLRPGRCAQRHQRHEGGHRHP